MFAIITGTIYMDLYEDNVIQSYRSQLKKQAKRIAPYGRRLVKN